MELLLQVVDGVELQDLRHPALDLLLEAESLASVAYTEVVVHPLGLRGQPVWATVHGALPFSLDVLELLELPHRSLLPRQFTLVFPIKLVLVDDRLGIYELVVEELVDLDAMGLSLELLLGV